MANISLLDIAARNNNDALAGLIEESLPYAPEVGIFPARTINGLFYNTLVRTGFPSVGFRAAGDGSTPSKSTYTKRMVEAFLFGGVIQFDKGTGMADERGLGQLEMDEAGGVVKQALINLGSQIWYGTTADAKGFTGIKAATPVGGATTLDSTGNTSSTQSSAYFVKFGNQDVTLVSGQGGSFTLSPFTDQQIAGATAGTWMPGRVSDLTAWVGMQIGNINCVGRIANLTVAVPLTDSLISQALEKFPVGYTPDAIFMNRRSRGQLQRSRSVVLQGSGKGDIGASSGLVAPIPEEAFGIPIYVTDSILSTDAHE